MSTVSILVMLVEDEALILLTLEEALKDGGYDVVTATRGEKALAVLESSEAPPRALVTDINIGGEITVWDLAHRARELHPEMPIIYMTGHAEEEWPSKGVPKSVLLRKPFAPAQLVTAVSNLLNTVNTPSAQ
jgi:DNA-binding response OmpR family regulator